MELYMESLGKCRWSLMEPHMESLGECTWTLV